MKHKQQSQKHIFSFYCPRSIQVSWFAGSTIWLQDQDLIHRLIKVIKIQKDDEFVLFDKKQHVGLHVLAVLKKEIQVCIVSIQSNVVLQPKITYLLPLLKKDALEQAVYSLAEIGVSEICLVITAKSRQSLMSEKELQRLCSIIIAAAEQSKNYVFPELLEPQELSEAVSGLSLSASKIVFDASGESFFDVRTKLKDLPEVALLVGPEGGLMQEELSLLENQNFQMCELTQTTLRAVQAVAVSAALFRLS